MRVVALAQGMLRRQRGDGQGEEIEQREDGVTAASWALSRLGEEQGERLSP